ncbi:MAG: transposase, partial [Candidatus Brocadiae bacterium]|nr:transposase [Candidatus Brocadiia bacterium]
RYPLHVNFYPSNNINCCKCFLSELKNKGYYPKSIITDGWDAYISSIKDIFPNAEHLLCHFHAVKRLFFRIKSAFHYTQAELLEMAAKLFQSDYKKTVTSRFEKLTQKLRDLGSEQIIKSLKAKMPTLLKSVGSSWRPSTANAAESFFSHFERFYRLKGPFPDEKSARKHLQLFMLGYLFTIGAESQPCPLEKIGYDVVQVPRPDIVALKNRMAS